jgi:peroxiredoxin
MFRWSVAVCLTTFLPGVGLADEPALRDEISQLRRPIPAPSVPPRPEKAEEIEKWLKQIEPVVKPYREEQAKRNLALGDAYARLLKEFPNIPDSAARSRDMIVAYLQALRMGGPDQDEARSRILPWLEKPGLSAGAALPLYAYQANMINIMSGAKNLDEIVPVTHDREEINPRLEQLVGKFGERYPKSRELAQLSLSIASMLDFGHKTIDDALTETLLKQAQEFGDDDIRRRVSTLEFRQHAAGHECPAVAFTAFDGKKIDLKELRGKVVLLDFWATWCGPCVGKIPEIKQLYQAGHDRGLEVLGISLDDDREKLAAFLKKNDLPWPQDFDGKGWDNEISSRFGVHAIPQVWLIDRQGIVAAVDPPDLKNQLERALAAPK